MWSIVEFITPETMGEQFSKFARINCTVMGRDTPGRYSELAQRLQWSGIRDAIDENRRLAAQGVAVVVLWVWGVMDASRHRHAVERLAGVRHYLFCLGEILKWLRGQI